MSWQAASDDLAFLYRMHTTGNCIDGFPCLSMGATLPDEYAKLPHPHCGINSCPL